MPVLSRAHTDAEHFEDQTLQIPVGSGPYRVAEVKPGERLVLERDPNYWAKDLPISRGLYNFDVIRIDYYRDATAMFEAFKAGLIDYRVEDDTNRWRTGYDFPAARDGRIVKAAIPSRLPKGVSGFAFNTAPRAVRRRPRARGAGVDVRLRVDQRQSVRRRLQALRGVLRRQRAVVDRPPGFGARARAARALSGRGARRCDGGPMARPGLRRHGPRPHDRAAARSTSSSAPAMRCATAVSSTRMARRSRSRSWSRTATRSALRSPMRAISRGSASPRTCGWSTRCSSSAGARASTST